MEKRSAAGPFARLRPKAVLGSGAFVGNFVEVKNSTIGQNTNVCHLTYLGDSSVGDGVNVGAGTVTCNFGAHLALPPSGWCMQVLHS